MSGFTVRDPGWEARVCALFSAAPFIRLLGIAPEELAPGRVETRLALEQRHRQQDGYVHAGVQATMADHSAGAAAATLAPAGTIVLTVEFKVSLLRPALGEALLCRAGVLRAGRRLTFCQSDVFALRDGAETHVASASVTIATMPQAASETARSDRLSTM